MTRTPDIMDWMVLPPDKTEDKVIMEGKGPELAQYLAGILQEKKFL